MYAKEQLLVDTTNIVAEAKAIKDGLSFYMEHDLHTLILETDSLLMKRIINGEWDAPWFIVAEVKRIKEMKEQFNVIFQRVLREGNTVADFLANLVFSFAGTIQFHSFSELPSVGKRLINLYKSQVPNLRVRDTKRKAPN